MNVATAAAARPTKIEVSEPLIAFLSTSRPHLSPPKGSVGAPRLRDIGAAPTWPSFRMSAITSASGSTDLPVSADGGATAAAAGFFSPRISASTSASGSTTSDLNSTAGADAPAGVTGAAGAPPSMSAPMNDGGA